MEIILFIAIFISFIAASIALPKWIKKCKQVGLLWEDMNKSGHPKNVAASGGVMIVLSFIIGVLSYVAIRTFFIKSMNGITLEVFALLSVILILAMVGLIDDLLGWKHGGLSIKFRILFAFVASIPLVVINAGNSVISLPFMGVVSLGWIYPIVLIPLGIVGAATTYNFLAGFNGLEAGQGIIILVFLSFISYITGTSWLALVGLIMVSALILFYFYNKFPAKVFPGDSLTWSIGALIASMAIIGNFEKIALFIFIPYIVEMILKLRGGLKKYSFGIPQKDGSLKLPYKKLYSLTHVAIWILNKTGKATEKKVVYLIYGIQILLCLSALIIFKGVLM